MQVPFCLTFSCRTIMKMLQILVIIISLIFTYAKASESSEYDENEPTYDEVYSVDQENELNSRIIGGQEAYVEQHPYQCSFIGNKSFFCGCSIIHVRYLMTAAHCAGVEPEQVQLRVGSTYRGKGTIIEIVEIKVHELYNVQPFDLDVAIFKTAEPIQFSDTVQPIGLIESGHELVPNSIFTVAGWGRTVHGAPTIPERLMAVNTTVVRKFFCRISYPSVFTDNMYCGGRFLLGGKGVCQGDSGGAAIQNGKAIGIVSFGKMCGQPFGPSVFTYLGSPAVRDFIKNYTGL